MFYVPPGADGVEAQKRSNMVSPERLSLERYLLTLSQFYVLPGADGVEAEKRGNMFYVPPGADGFEAE